MLLSAGLAGWAGEAKSMAVEFGATEYSTPRTGGLSSGGEAQPLRRRLLSRRDAARRARAAGETGQAPSLQKMVMRRRASDPGRGRVLRKPPGRGAKPGWQARPWWQAATLLRRRGLRRSE